MNNLELRKREIVKFFLKKNILVNKDLLKKLDKESEVEKFYTQIKSGHDLGIPQTQDKTPDESSSSVRILLEYEREGRKIEAQDFIGYFNSRYKSLEKMLKSRQELGNLNLISRVLNKVDKESVSIIGMVTNKRTSKNGNLIITLEDNSGEINIIVNKNKPDLFKLAGDLVLDEVIGVVGVNGKKIVFANNLIFPDIPVNTDLKRAPDEAYVVVISDMHVGSTKFLEKEFNKFLRWINGEYGNEEQRGIAQKVKYILVAGDVVDGIGIYPSQEEELSIRDIYKQYEECARLFSQIPKNIKIIIGPGNHDALRIAEPQPKLSKDYARSLWDLPNVIMVGNPAYINIHSSENFQGFDVLLYHGYSFDDYGVIVESIKNSGKHISDRAPHIMKFLLQRRHLAPTHTTTLYIPDKTKDPLVISKVPDFFVAGHIHKAAAINYRGVSIICSSCWQDKTDFQEKVGHDPDPCRVPVINLKTREVKILNFSK